MILYSELASWLNENQGVLTLSIFFATIFLGWVSGIFSALRRRPKFNIRLIDGPTFACTFPIGKLKGQFEMHRTCISLYLGISNVGSSASSIELVSVAYHWNLRPFSLLWIKYSVGWFWLDRQAVALENFQGRIGGYTKIFPFLFQGNIGVQAAGTFLNVGQSINGVVYFEQVDSWGGSFPKAIDGQIAIKVKVLDVFGKAHFRKFNIPAVSLAHARKYNPAFGKTLLELNGEKLPCDPG